MIQNKALSLAVFSLFVVVASVALASAATSTVFNVSNLNTPSTVSEVDGSFTFTFQVNYHGTSTDADISFSDSTISGGTISIPTVTDLNGTMSGGDIRTVTGTISGFSSLGGQTLNAVINATVVGTTARDDETTFSTQVTQSTFSESNICAYDGGVTSNTGYLTVEIDSVEVVRGFGEDEDWIPFDEVEVEIVVENNGVNDYDIDDISVEWGIAGSSLSGDWLLDLDEVEEFNIKDGDEETFVITFTVDEDDLDMDLDEFVGQDWTLVVRATGEIDDEDDLLTSDDTCAADSQEVSIDENNAVVLTNIEIPETLQCGQTYTITADVWNLGNDQEDEVKVDVYDRNRDIINDLFELGDIDEFDSAFLSFDLRVPQGLDEATYTLILDVLDEDSDVYEIGPDDDEVQYTLPLTVSGCTAASDLVTVSAALDSDAVEGKPLTVRATITNNANSQGTFAVSASGYAAWADSVTVDTPTVLLAAGESKEVVLVFDVKDDVEGTQTFAIEVVSGNSVKSQPVQVNIEPKGLFGFTGSAISGSGGLWALGLINVILIIAIIIVAIRVARR